MPFSDCCLTLYVKEFLECHVSVIDVLLKKYATKVRRLSLIQHWITEQQDIFLECVTNCEFPNHHQCKNLLASIFLEHVC